MTGTSGRATGEGLIERARALADDLLFARAVETDNSPLVPVDLLDALAVAGLYGLACPAELGGSGAGVAVADDVVRLLAGGCLTTTFVWLQHHGAVATVAAGPDELRRGWLRPLCAGERRAGVAFAGLRRPGPPVLVARPVDGGCLLDGYAPWVTGWGRIDVVHTAARDASGDVVWNLVDARECEGLRSTPLRLAAVNASGTVTLYFEALFVPASRLTLREPFEVWRARDASGLRRNGSLALGLADRASRLLADAGVDTGALTARIGRSSAALDAAGPAELPAARGEASATAVQASTMLVIATGGRSLLLGEHAQRLAREALFLLVFGQTPAIRAAQIATFDS
jgi:alkylation response protein AidB-like acyl-CoA dehydrogenase